MAGHLRDGRVAEAFAAYPAKLLNRSVNLAIGFMRDELNKPWELPSGPAVMPG